MTHMAIYKEGEEYVKTTVTNGKCDYTGALNDLAKDYTVEQYLKKLEDGYSCIPLDEAIEKITAIRTDKYIKPWDEITEVRYAEMLEVLPPEKWLSVNGVNIFRLCEYTDSTITMHFGSINGRYFQAHKFITDRYEKLADEILAKYKEVTNA